MQYNWTAQKKGRSSKTINVVICKRRVESNMRSMAATLENRDSLSKEKEHTHNIQNRNFHFSLKAAPLSFTLFIFPNCKTILKTTQNKKFIKYQYNAIMAQFLCSLKSFSEQTLNHYHSHNVCKNIFIGKLSVI